MGYIWTTIRIHSLIPSWPKTSRGVQKKKQDLWRFLYVVLTSIVEIQTPQVGWLRGPVKVLATKALILNGIGTR